MLVRMMNWFTNINRRFREGEGGPQLLLSSQPIEARCNLLASFCWNISSSSSYPLPPQQMHRVANDYNIKICMIGHGSGRMGLYASLGFTVSLRAFLRPYPHHRHFARARTTSRLSRRSLILSICWLSPIFVPLIYYTLSC